MFITLDSVGSRPPLLQVFASFCAPPTEGKARVKTHLMSSGVPGQLDETGGKLMFKMTPDGSNAGWLGACRNNVSRKAVVSDAYFRAARMLGLVGEDVSSVQASCVVLLPAPENAIAGTPSKADREAAPLATYLGYFSIMIQLD
jgi:hypothetical protein